MPREPIHSAPHAARAETAATVDIDADLMLLLGARSICYGGFSANTSTPSFHIIMRKMQTGVSIETTCQGINTGWHACGVAKSNAVGQNCVDLNNNSYGLGYTSFVRANAFTPNRASEYSSCDETNAVVCCSPSCGGW